MNKNAKHEQESRRACNNSLEDEVELFCLDHNKLHNPFQSFISAAASLEK